MRTNLTIDRTEAVEIMEAWNAGIKPADIAEALGLPRRWTTGIQNVICGRIYPDLQAMRRPLSRAVVMERLNARGVRRDG